MTNQQQNTAAGRANQLLVEGLLGAGRQEEAISLCRRICSLPAAAPRDWLLYGCLCADTGDTVTARTALKKALSLDPGLTEAWFALGKLQVAIGKPVNAVVRLEKAAQLQPDNAEIWLTLGIAYGLANQVDKAEACCRRSVELQPGSAPARFNLGNALKGQGKLKEAETEYEAALQFEPGLAVGWSMLAKTCAGLRKFDEAEAAARRALSLNPRLGEAHFTLGDIFDELGDVAQARDHFRQTTELMPEFPEAHWRLGLILVKLKEYSAAAESFNTVLRFAPGLAKVHTLMGECFYHSKIYGRAENCFRKAIAIDKNYFGAHMGLAFTLRAMQREAEYEKQLVECVRINPNEGQARHLLAMLRGETTSAAPADYVRQVFDGYADHFDAHLVGALDYHTPEHLHDMVKQFLSPTADLLSITDLGCGTGLCAPLFRGMARTLHGVDLSPRMIEKARARNLYDALEVGDIVASLKAQPAAWDLAIAADVLIYIGDLKEVFDACLAALKPGGMFAFSVEAGDDADAFVLRKSGRYAHSSKYIRSLSDATGFQEIQSRSVILRKEAGEDMHGYLYLLRRVADLA